MVVGMAGEVMLWARAGALSVTGYDLDTHRIKLCENIVQA